MASFAKSTLKGGVESFVMRRGNFFNVIAKNSVSDKLKSISVEIGLRKSVLVNLKTSDLRAHRMWKQQRVGAGYDGSGVMETVVECAIQASFAPAGHF